MTDFGKRFGHLYVDRGDTADPDFTLSTLTTDGTWRDLDLSAVVPAGAKLVHLYVTVKDDAAYNYFQFRKNGNSNLVNIALCMEVLANLAFYFDFFVSCDSDRLIEYWASNTTFTAVNITTRGWFI